MVNDKIISYVVFEQCLIFFKILLQLLPHLTLSIGLCGRQRTYNYVHFID